MTHGDNALDNDASFFAVVEHRLIPAGVRSEVARLNRAGYWSVWAPANQKSGHVGHAGVGVVRLGVPLCHYLPLRLLLSLLFCTGHGLEVSGRVMHLVVVNGFLRSYGSLNLSWMILCELSVVASWLVGDLNI